MNGWKELTFSLPFHIDGKENWRNEFLRGEYLVRLINGDVADWFILHAPAKSHKGMTALYEVTCSHVSALLNL